MSLTTQGTRRSRIEQEARGGEGGEKERGGVVFLIVLPLLSFRIRYNCTIHLSQSLINFFFFRFYLKL